MAAVLLLGVVSMAVLLSSLSSSNAATQQAIKTQIALKEVKEAVLGYILLDDPNPDLTLKPGSLPCPDLDNDNDNDFNDNVGASCGPTGNFVYRFPGKNFRVGDLRDASNEGLWYAVSPDFRTTTDAALNSLTPGELRIDGQGEYVAVVLAPGAPLPGQTRSTSSTRTAYLEEENASGTFHLVTFRQPQEGESEEQAKSKFNDRVLGISKKEWEDAIIRRVSADVLSRIKSHVVATGRPPSPMPLSAYETSPDGRSPTAWNGDSKHSRGLLPASTLWAPTDWARKNQWYRVVYYVIAPALAAGDTDCSASNECLTLLNGGMETKNIKALIIFAGSTHLGQTRSENSTVADYLEGAENQDDDNVFELPGTSSTSNDRFYIIK